MNKPYVKIFDNLGLVANQITKNEPFINKSENRSARREPLHKKVFKGNKKGVSLSVSGNFKYKRTVQLIKLKDGSVKQVFHQMPS